MEKESTLAESAPSWLGFLSTRALQNEKLIGSTIYKIIEFIFFFSCAGPWELRERKLSSRYLSLFSLRTESKVRKSLK